MIFYILGWWIVFGFLLFLLSGFLAYALESKISGELSSVTYMEEVYRKYGDSPEGIMLLDATGREYLVRDSDGRELLRKGAETMNSQKCDTGITVSLLGVVNFGLQQGVEANDVAVYTDKNSVYLTADKNGVLVFDLKHFREDLAGSSVIDILQEEGEDAQLENIRVIHIPLWISVGTADGGEFIAGVELGLDVRDVLLLLIVFFSLMMLALLVVIVLVGNVIKNLARQKRLQDFFFTDEVTDGKNWMCYLINGEKILRKRRNAGKRYAVVHFAIVKYRNYCMCHSIAAGESILKRVNQCLSAAVTRREMAAHVSSGSFALLLEMENEAMLGQRLQSIIESMSIMDPTHHFTFQAGVFVIEANLVGGKLRKRRDVDLERDYNNACAAKATLEKTDDNGLAFFDQELCELRKWEDMVSERQERALANGEFLVYYQPKYAPDTEELKGAEALIRWRSPEFGLVSPGRFIPLFEKSGFITQIDHYMLAHVAADQRAWLDAGYKCVPVSVNVSRAHFAEADLAEQIRDIVDAAGTPHELIEIELTESAFFDDKNALIRTLERLKSYGFSVSMDDFGSGYSSLNSLKDMSLDVLKLDADFFRGDADEKRKEIVVSEAIRLAKCLNMRTVAEGVEEKEQVEFLAGQGCDMIQGFVFAKPMPREEYMERMRGAEGSTEI